jgi:hypothetical protein
LIEYLQLLKKEALVRSRASLAAFYLLSFICAIAPLRLQAQVKIGDISSFRPRREMTAGQFIGNQGCLACHTEKNGSQSTAMTPALGFPADNKVLQSHSHMRFRAGPYTYEIVSDGKQGTFQVTDGKQTVSEPIAYVFGDAHVAQTYILQHNGRLYEGRVSYYTTIDGLDWTIGDVLNPAPSLEAAFGRDITGDEAKNCFSCHGTGAVLDGKLKLDHLTPGVACEACHGPGEMHVAFAQSTGESGMIFNPKVLNPDTLSQDFCGACHRSANTVGMMPDLGGSVNVRFQPYRLAGSRGHDTNDPNLACTACHDPHIDLSQQSPDADSKCTICHLRRSSTSSSIASLSEAQARVARPPKACPVSNAECMSCHMPKVEIPGAHFKFTDHRIRIVRPGERYPI